MLLKVAILASMRQRNNGKLVDAFESQQYLTFRTNNIIQTNKQNKYKYRYFSNYCTKIMRINYEIVLA